MEADIDDDDPNAQQLGLRRLLAAACNTCGSPQEEECDRCDFCKALKCYLCEGASTKAYASLAGLKVHLRSCRKKRAGVEESECSNCNRRFASFQGLRVHERTHVDDYCRSTARVTTVDPDPAPPLQSDAPPPQPSTSSRRNTTRRERRQTDADWLAARSDEWLAAFKTFENADTESFDPAAFNDAVIRFQVFLRDAIHRLPGPEHPGTKYYKQRRRHAKIGTKMKKRSGQYGESTNPQRADAKKKADRKQQYTRDLCQWYYYNIRKRAVQLVESDGKSKSCSIPMNELHTAFTKRFSTVNNATRHDNAYGRVQSDDQEQADADYPSSVPVADAAAAIKGIKIDSSPGPDNVYARALKAVDANGAIIATMLTTMLKHNAYPDALREADTILLDKGGDESDSGNWRPITIFSIIRRALHRVLDSHLRKHARFNKVQRGFMKTPGCLVNIRLLNRLMSEARKHNRPFYAVLYDVAKAFDNVGHEHLRRVLTSMCIPTSLRAIIIKSLDGNFTKLRVGGAKSARIELLRGVAQGDPLSATLFNLAIDFALDELTDGDLMREHACHVDDNLSLAAAAFADDTASLSERRQSASRQASIFIEALSSVGLPINEKKSLMIGLMVEHGRLRVDQVDLMLPDGRVIPALKVGESTRYLGAWFVATSDSIVEQVFPAQQLLTALDKSLTRLRDTELLRPDQKLLILQQYIWPRCVYPLQVAPLEAITREALDAIDRLICRSVRHFLMLPERAPNNFLFSSRSARGLGIPSAQAEVHLQHANAAYLLRPARFPDFANLFQTDLESNVCAANLQVEMPEITPLAIGGPATRMRAEWRRKQLATWSALQMCGIGVELFSDAMPASHRWLVRKGDLSTSEYTNAVKMTANLHAVNSLPFRATGESGGRCRRCQQPHETLGHILGSCPTNNGMINTRHHNVCALICDELQESGWETHREQPCIADDGTNRRVDILAVDRTRKKAFILDPTVRFERTVQQVSAAELEKRTIYEATASYFKREYHVDTVGVIGLWFGSRGTVPKTFANHCRTLGIGSSAKSLAERISRSILRDSACIVSMHLYSPA